MTGKFNETTRRLLRESEGNGGLDNKALFDLMVAGHEEGLESAAKLARETKESADALAVVLASDRMQIARIAAHLESEAGTINRAILAHCADVNAHRRAPRRVDDPSEYDFSGIPQQPQEDEQMGDIRRAWRFGRWVVMALAAASMAFGLSYWADSCARAHYWGNEPPIIATPSPTATK